MEHARDRMLGWLSGYWISQTLYVAAELGIPDALAQAPHDVETLASTLAVDADALRRLLNALVSVGVFARSQDGRFVNTALSETLRTGPGSLRAVARLGGHPSHWGAWGKLLEAVRSGEAAFTRYAAEPFFETLDHDSQLCDLFQTTQAALPERDGAVAEVLPLGAARRIIDVGGGQGALARVLAERFRDAEVILFERPEVVARLGAPAPFVGMEGDFFDAVPEADAIVLKHVLHDWNDSAAKRLLTTCRRALGQSSKLCIVEVLLPDDDDISPSPARCHDVNMLVLTGGRERMLSEYDALLRAVGLRREEPPRRVGSCPFWCMLRTWVNVVSTDPTHRSRWCVPGR